ncbi:MAG TPA: cytochrome c maturation protein CcmE [Dongiaceae bacterium]
MSRKRLRLYLVLATLVVLGIAATLILRALNEELVFFLSPTQIAEEQPGAGRQIRLGGLVEAGSVKKAGENVAFSVTDLNKAITVNYRGLLPDLFREGQGVVVEGAFDGGGRFVASEVLAKHDETYMPPEVAKALKASGRWQETQGKGTEAAAQ